VGYYLPDKVFSFYHPRLHQGRTFCHALLNTVVHGINGSIHRVAVSFKGSLVFLTFLQQDLFQIFSPGLQRLPVALHFIQFLLHLFEAGKCLGFLLRHLIFDEKIHVF